MTSEQTSKADSNFTREALSTADRTCRPSLTVAGTEKQLQHACPFTGYAETTFV